MPTKLSNDQKEALLAFDKVMYGEEEKVQEEEEDKENGSSKSKGFKRKRKK